jgi:MFS family permease
LSYYLNNNYFPNTSALDYAFIGGLSISQAMLVAPLATRVIHLYGTKVCLHLGIFFETLSLIAASFAKKKYEIILAQGFCFGYGMGFLFVGSVGIISQWFTKRRALANAIGAAGSGLGGLTYSLVVQRVIDKNGLPWAFRVLGICSFAANLVASNLIRDRNKLVGARHRSFDLSLLKRPEFLLMQGWSWFSMFGYVILLFSLAAYCRAIGLSAQQSSVVSAVLNAGQALGRPFIGLSSDRWGRINLATAFTFICAMLCFALWLPAETLAVPMGLLCVFAIFGGATAGTYWATIAPVAAEVVGLQDLPSALSWTWLSIVPPTTVAEPIGLELRRKHAQNWIYLPPQLFTAFMYIAAGLCIWVLRGWKIGEMAWADKIRADIGAEQVFSEEKLFGSGVGVPARSGDTGNGTPDLDEFEIARARSLAIWKPGNLLRNMILPKVV